MPAAGAALQGLSYQDAYDRILGQEGVREGSQLTYYCPFDGCEGYDQRKFYVDPNTGTWFCQHCRHQVDWMVKPGGGWLDFLWEVGEDTKKWPKIQAREREEKHRLPRVEAKALWNEFLGRLSLNNYHRRLMEQRGIDADRARFLSADHRVWKELLAEIGEERMVLGGLACVYDRGPNKGTVQPTQCCRPGRLIVPHWSGSQAEYFVGYQRKPDDWRSTWTKIANITGYPPVIYGTVPRKPPYLVVTEGQLKTESARQRGFPCVGLPGIGSQHFELAELCAKRGVTQVIIVFDTETRPRVIQNVDQACLSLSEHLLERRISVYRGRLPLDPEVDGGQKMDIDAFLYHQGTDAFTQVLKASRREKYVLR